jgi:hypothetical protein
LEIKIYKNGSLLGTYSSVASGTYFPAMTHTTNGATSSTNFGQRAFAYSAPSGYKALCTTNLPDPTIADGSDYMDAALYTGNGTTQTISGLGFSPDLVWTKARSAANSHALWDTVRGVEKRLISNATDAEATRAGGLTAFTSDGFTHGDDSTGNDSSTTYVAWSWDAGTSTVSNTDGSITSSVRANASAGFSIVTYTGTGSAATVGHGLNAAPEMVIVKDKSGTGGYGWRVYHKSLSSGYVLYLNNTNAQTSESSAFTSAPTSTVVNLGTSGGTNSTEDFVMYAFAPVEGYSAFGSYTGNGSTDGPFVYTGHRVKYLMVKRTDSTGDWFILDGAREPYNYVSRQLGANNSGAESGPDVYNVDFTSNGFKIRNSVAGFNASSGSYVYMSFAENPFKTARAR